MADTYYASVRESTAGANKRHLTIFNGAGSGLIMTVYRIVAAGTPTGTVTGMVVPLAAIRILAAPTDGTALTSPGYAKARPAGHPSENPDLPAQILGRTNATTPSAGNLEPIAFGLGTVSGEETASTNESRLYEAPIDGSQAIEFPEGTGFEVRQLTLASAGAISVIAVVGFEPNV